MVDISEPEDAVPRPVHAEGEVSDRLPLPWKARLRLRANRRVDATADWLLKQGFERVAIGLWRICRMW